VAAASVPVPDSGRGLGTHDFTWTAALGLRVVRAQVTATAGTAT
jgi:hypothetical protein